MKWCCEKRLKKHATTGILVVAKNYEEEILQELQQNREVVSIEYTAVLSTDSNVKNL